MPAFQPILPDTERNKEVTEGLTGFLPPGMDMVLESLLSAFLPTTDEDAMQQMSDSVLADLALGIQIPGQKKALASILEDTFGQTKKALKTSRSEDQLGLNLVEEFGSKTDAQRNSRVVPQHFTALMDNILAAIRVPGGRGGMPKGNVENQVMSLIAGEPAGMRPNAQMILSNDAFKPRVLGSDLLARAKGNLPQDELIAHELGHILEQGVPIPTVRALMDSPGFPHVIRSILRDVGRRDVLSSGNRLFQFSEGLASFLESGQRLPRSVTNRVPQIEGLDELILEMVKDLK